VHLLLLNVQPNSIFQLLIEHIPELLRRCFSIMPDDVSVRSSLLSWTFLEQEDID